MVPYSSPRSVTVGIVLHRNGGRTPDFVSKERRRKPQGRWSLRRQFALHCFDLHRIAQEVRETGVEPARVSPLDPKSSASANSATLASALPSNSLRHSWGAVKSQFLPPNPCLSPLLKAELPQSAYLGHVGFARLAVHVGDSLAEELAEGLAQQEKSQPAAPIGFIHE